MTTTEDILKEARKRYSYLNSGATNEQGKIVLNVMEDIVSFLLSALDKSYKQGLKDSGNYPLIAMDGKKGIDLTATLASQRREVVELGKRYWFGQVALGKGDDVIVGVPDNLRPNGGNEVEVPAIVIPLSHLTPTD